jgi:hypothetical protein
MANHPSWEQIRAQYLSDPEVRAQYDKGYQPVVRDRKAERSRMEENALYAYYRSLRGNA